MVITYHNVSVAAIQHYSTKAVTDNAQTNGHFYVPIKVHLPKWAADLQDVVASLCSREQRCISTQKPMHACLKQLCNCQKVEITQMFLSHSMDKQTSTVIQWTK